jgi:hypothetical protein
MSELLTVSNGLILQKLDEIDAFLAGNPGDIEVTDLSCWADSPDGGQRCPAAKSSDNPEQSNEREKGQPVREILFVRLHCHDP